MGFSRQGQSPRLCATRERSADGCAATVRRRRSAATTLLVWSSKGGRACDDALRKRYPECSKSALSQNLLGSTMTINGVIVDRFRRDLGFPLVESHPKLVHRVWLKKHMAGSDFARYHDKLLQNPNDREADVLVIAWCASRWRFGHWAVDLYDVPVGEDEPIFSAGKAVYPQQEPVGGVRCAWVLVCGRLCLASHSIGAHMFQKPFPCLDDVIMFLELGDVSGWVCGLSVSSF